MLTGCELLQIQNNKMQPDRQNALYHDRDIAENMSEALYKDAKAEFDRMKTYFYEPSSSTIASPLVVAPKATAPYIRLCGDYRQINGYINIPQEPIPHVQQTLSKAAGWKYFVDLDMTNSFHQILLSHTTSLLLSVSTPWDQNSFRRE